jgi:hypothetical protein
MPIDWNEDDWRSVWMADGSHWIGYAYGGEFVQTRDGHIQLRFPMCEACNAHCKSLKAKEILHDMGG